jgi:hypothetical protein
MAKPPANPLRSDVESPPWWREGAMLAIGLTLALRLGLGIVMGAAWAVARPTVAGLVPAGTFGELAMPESLLGELTLGVWVRWDAVHHLNLAQRGYFDMGPGSTVFFPLYAGLTGGLGRLLGGDFILAGLALSTLATAFSLLLLIQVGREVFGVAAGRWAAIALAVYPTAVFLVAPFSESLFLALTLGGFLAAYRTRWVPAALLAFLASLTRGPGMAASAAFAILGWMQWRSAPPAGRRPSWLAVGAAVLAPLAGGACFLVWRWYAGFPPLLEVLYDYVGTSAVNPVRGLALAFSQWVRVRDLPTTADVLSAFGFLGITLAMAFKPRWRRPELLAYMALSLFVLFSRHTVGAAALKSLSRYVLVLFPAFLIVGDWLAGARPWARFTYLAISGSLLILASLLYSLWFFLG